MANAVVRYLRAVTVEPVLFLFMLGFFIQGPILQLLIIQKVCRLTYDDTECSNKTAFRQIENDVERESTRWILYFNLCANLPGAIMATIFGPLSDKFGRKVIMALPSAGACVAAVNFILNSFYIDWPVETLLLSAFAMGITGNLGTFFVSVVSYITDITDPSSRMKRLGLLEAMVYIGGTVGLVAGGWIQESVGFAAVFILYLILHVTILIYVFTYLKESLPVEDRVALNQNGSVDGAEEQRTNVAKQCCGYVVDSFKRAMSVLFLKRKGSRRKHLILNAMISITGVIAQAGDMDLTILYTKHSPLSWPPSTTGIYLALRTIMKGVALVFVMPIIAKLTNHSTPDRDMVWAELGLISTIAGYVTMAVAKSTGLMMSVSVIGCLFGLTRAVQGSIATRLVESTEFGAMFACSSLVEASCLMLGSIFFNNLYRATLDFWPGFSFLVMSLLAIVSLIFAVYLQYDMKSDWSEEYQEKGDGVRKLLNDNETEDDDEEVEIINFETVRLVNGLTASATGAGQVETNV
ncbi:proton-coupled folate transporter-like [Diadema antillarum]|uniref:proton-coupled folate transporter-like n=1 Tax=Diadema antillarum TaxID=105358 RepID=UPI003A8A5F0B